MLKDAKNNMMNHKMELERQQMHVASASALSLQKLEDVQDANYSLKGLLEAARRELDDQKNEVAFVRSSLQETILHTQRELMSTQVELVRMQSKLIEVENDHLRGASNQEQKLCQLCRWNAINWKIKTL
jgi:hypothetical protein